MTEHKKYISQLNSFSNCGVWRDFNNQSNVELAPKTLIYGFNGTGKTTLSRALSSLKEGKLDEKLPSNTKFEIKISDDSTIGSENLRNPFENNFLVFNQDFIEKNFEWVEGKAEGIAYISEANLEKKAAYEQSCTKYDEALQKLETCNEGRKKADQANSSFKTYTAKRIRELAPSTRHTQSYDARKIDPAYAEREYTEADMLSGDMLKTQQMLLGQDAPLPTINKMKGIKEGIQEWFQTTLYLLIETPGSVAISDLEQHPSMLEWAAIGGRYHAEQALENCLLCGNRFSKSRKEQLRQLYDGAWNAFSENLTKAKQDCEAFRDSFREQYGAIPKDSEFQPDQRKPAETAITAVKSRIEEIGKLINEMLAALEQKQSLPTAGEIPDSISAFEFSSWQEETRKQIDNLNAVITTHNKASEDFEKQQQDAFLAIRNHVLADERNTQSEVKKACIETKEAEEKVAAEVRTSETQRDTLHNELSNHGIGAEKLNALLAMYLGHNDIQLNALDIGYQIIRANGKVAENLSEGEKTALSFCYFLTLFSAEGRDPKDLVLVIDDPISSLDTSAQTHALSLLNRLTKKCAQTIILTHNLSFMNMIKREYQNLQKRNSENKVSALLALDCRNSTENPDERKTILTKLDPLLADYDTEYHFLFNLVYQASEVGHSQHQYLLPNSTRKLLEMFTAFIAPDEPNFTAALMRNHEQLKDKLELKALERLVQIGSHGSLDGISTPPSLTIEEAIKASQAAMLFIKVLSPVHFKSMKKLTI